jgi:hypothetical protein
VNEDIQKSEVPGARYVGRFRFDPPDKWIPFDGFREHKFSGSGSYGCYEVTEGVYDVWDESKPRVELPAGISLN